jgi:hypothetical protein
MAQFAPADYAVLFQENLFHPERKVPPPAKKEEMALPRPDVTLYGTYITSESRLAFIEEKSMPVTSPGRGQRHTIMKPGEKVLGFELKRIEPDRIVFVKDKETLTVLLNVKKQRSGGTGTGIQPSYAAAGNTRDPGRQQQFNGGQPGPGSVRPVTPNPPLMAPPPPTRPVPTPPITPTRPVQQSAQAHSVPQ